MNEASNGAVSAGNEVLRFDLFELERFTGCRSCFCCKKEKFKGTCVVKDGLAPVLSAIEQADGLIIGSPNYLSDLTASFRALYERLIFKNLTYNVEKPCCNGKMIPTLLIMTCNAPEQKFAYVMENYKSTFCRFIGPTQYMISGNTLQLNDYTKTDWPWTLFNVESKIKQHNEVFPLERKRAFELGKNLLK